MHILLVLFLWRTLTETCHKLSLDKEALDNSLPLNFTYRQKIDVDLFKSYHFYFLNTFWIQLDFVTFMIKPIQASFSQMDK